MAPRRASDTRDEAERSFEQLYRGHRGDVYRAALRELGNVHDAEDVTQAAFVDAYRAVLNGTRPQAPRAWLLTIAENVRRRRFRSSLRRPREEPLDADTVAAAEESHEQAGALLDALATLTAEQREAFLLREITGLSYDEIAERTDSTVASVQMLLFRARKTLREELEPPAGVSAYLPLATLLSRFEGLSVAPRAAGAVGAAALAVSVGASVPAKADSPAPPAAPRAVLIAAAPVAVTATPARQAPARLAPAVRRVPRAAPKPFATRTAGQPVPAPAAAPRSPATPQPQQPASEPQPETAQPQPETPQTQPAPESQAEVVTPPALPVASPAVPTPSIPPPPLPELVEPLLEGAGAAGAAGADAPPLPLPPLDPLPPIP